MSKSPKPELDKHIAQVKHRALHFWQKLPSREKEMCDLEELIAVGLLVYHRCALSFDPSNGAKFNTYLYTALSNRFKDFIGKAYKRGEVNLCALSVQDLERGLREGEPKQSRQQTYAWVRSCNTMQNPSFALIQICEAEHAVNQMLRRIAPEDRTMVQLLVFGEAETLPANPARSYRRFLPRLRELFETHGITYEHIRVLRHATTG